MEVVVIRKVGKRDSTHELVVTRQTFIAEEVVSVHGSVLGTICVHTTNGAVMRDAVHTLLKTLYANPSDVHVSRTALEYRGLPVVFTTFDNPYVEHIVPALPAEKILSFEEMFRCLRPTKKS